MGDRVRTKAILVLGGIGAGSAEYQQWAIEGYENAIFYLRGGKGNG